MRFIPAGAGNRIIGIVVIILAVVHPRRCGEQKRARPPRRAVCGSSPQVRGTAGHRRRQGHHVRFIPAGAGNSSAPAHKPKMAPVHPRRCGEQAEYRRMVVVLHGSSPQVRGTGLLGELGAIKVRFIPAGAGNRVPNRPRVTPVNGSSPQVRGTAGPPDPTPTNGRFIPAGAGNRVAS